LNEEEVKKGGYYKEPRYIEVWLKTGAVVTGVTTMVPFVVDDFGGTYLRFKDVNDAWHNMEPGSIVAIHVYLKSKVEELMKEEAEETTGKSQELLNKLRLLRGDDDNE
jgi:hypothetical protein